MMGRSTTPVLLLSALLLTACPPPLALTIYNNSGADLAVLIDGRRIEWPAGKALRISGGAGIKWEDLQWEDDPQRHASAPVLVVNSRAGVSRYRLAIPGLPDEYIDSRTGVKERFLQLERDGGLYVVKAGAAFPVDVLPRQPAGLPIRAADG